VRVYEGTRNSEGVLVTVGTLTASWIIENRQPLAPRLDLRNHSPAGFEWGYGGSGPSQLALALCADALDNYQRAQEVYQHYKWAYVCKFPQAGWRLTQDQVLADVNVLEGLA
jgi:hypothetical protein